MKLGGLGGSQVVQKSEWPSMIPAGVKSIIELNS